MLILVLKDETSTSWDHYTCFYPLNRSSKAIAALPNLQWLVQRLTPQNPVQKLSSALKNLGWERDSHDYNMRSDLTHVHQALAMPSVLVCDPQRLGKTPQIISLISIQKCEQLKAKNFTSAGEWQKVARTQSLKASRQKENDVNTSFRCAIKSYCDTMGCCQSKRPRLTPLLLTLHTPPDIRWATQEVCLETLILPNLVDGQFSQKSTEEG